MRAYFIIRGSITATGALPDTTPVGLEIIPRPATHDSPRAAWQPWAAIRNPVGIRMPPMPKALRPKARGWTERASPGMRSHGYSTPTGLYPGIMRAL
jgi:hypothetical protein